MNRTFFIYKLTAPNGKVYIGQTYNINRRFSCYRNSNIPNQNKLSESIKKYGWSNFKKEIIFDGVVSQDEIDALETYYIQKYFDFSLNISPSGKGGNGLSGSKHPRSKPVLRIDMNFNVVEEYENATIAAEKTKTNQSFISLSCKTDNPKANGYYWRFKEGYNREHLIEIINKPHKASISIVQMDKNRNVIKIWESQAKASKELNINQANIWRVLNGEGYSAGGFCWAYTYEHENNIAPSFRYKKRGKRVNVKSLDGSLLYTFESIKELCSELKIDKSSVSRQLNGIIKNPLKYIYEYA